MSRLILRIQAWWHGLPDVVQVIYGAGLWFFCIIGVSTGTASLLIKIGTVDTAICGTWQVGDLVRLRSGGPVFIIDSDVNTNCKVDVVRVELVDGRPKRNVLYFDTRTLERVDK
jgi:hypothetical protein